MLHDLIHFKLKLTILMFDTLLDEKYICRYKIKRR